jgi:hypothetical protein
MLECVICFERYSEADIVAGRYWAEPAVCSECYALMQSRPYSASCFGKPSVVNARGKRLLGYNPKAIECRQLCPDRAVCRRIVWVTTNPV